MRTTSPAVWVAGGALGFGAVLMGASMALTAFQSSSTSDPAVVVHATYQAPSVPASSAKQLPNAPVSQPGTYVPTSESGAGSSGLPDGGTLGTGTDQPPLTLPPAPTPVVTAAPLPTVASATVLEAGATLVPQPPAPQVAPTTAPQPTSVPTASATSATSSPTKPGSSQAQSPGSTPGQSSTACVTNEPAPQATSPVPGWWPSWLPYPSFFPHPTHAADSNARRARGCPHVTPTPSAETATTLPAPRPTVPLSVAPDPGATSGPTAVSDPTAKPDGSATKTNNGRSNGDPLPAAQPAKPTAVTTAVATTKAHGNAYGQQDSNPNANANANADANAAATKTKAKAAAG